MTYATITSSNMTYQPRENLKALLEANIQSGISIYSTFPNLKNVGFKGFPFIVIPESSISPGEAYVGDMSFTYNNEVEGTIYHDYEKLADNKLRNTKQAIVQAITNRANQVTLRGYKMDNLNVTFDMQPVDPVIENQKQIIPVEFTITFSLDLNMG